MTPRSERLLSIPEPTCPSPFHAPAPYNFAIYNVDGRFIAYVDTTQIVIPQLNTYRDKLVEIRGAIVKDDGDTVLRAESMKIKR